MATQKATHLTPRKGVCLNLGWWWWWWRKGVEWGGVGWVAGWGGESETFWVYLADAAGQTELRFLSQFPVMTFPKVNNPTKDHSKEAEEAPTPRRRRRGKQHHPQGRRKKQTTPKRRRRRKAQHKKGKQLKTAPPPTTGEAGKQHHPQGGSHYMHLPHHSSL